MGINKVFLSGNLTRDPEMRTTNNGFSILGFGIAVNDRRQNKQTGEWEDVPNFIDCNVLGRRAESLASMLHKGMKVTVEGKLHYSSWEDRETGQRRSKIDVTVDNLELPPRQRNQEGGYTQADMYSNDDIPF